MKKQIRNILLVLLAIISGMLVNMGLVMLGSVLVPAPEGVDVTTVEGLQKGIHLLEFKHYIFPFLAHAFGTWTGAFVIAYFMKDYAMHFAIGIGGFFLVGGIANVFLIPTQISFTVIDLLGAYIPMSLLGWKHAVFFKR